MSAGADLVVDAFIVLEYASRVPSQTVVNSSIASQLAPAAMPFRRCRVAIGSVAAATRGRVGGAQLT